MFLNQFLDESKVKTMIHIFFPIQCKRLVEIVTM